MSDYTYQCRVDRRDASGNVHSDYWSTKTLSTGALHDVSANAVIPGRIMQPGLLDLTMYGNAKTRGAREVGHGAAVLNNADGGLDAYLGYAFDNEGFFVWRTPESAPNDSTSVFSGRLEQCEVTEKTVTLYVRDYISDSEKSCVPTLFLGTNVLPSGIEGTASDLKGKVRPRCLGKVFNISPPQVNTSKLIYMVDGYTGFFTGWSMTVYDQRTALVAGATYTDQADMEANAPAAGEYRVWVAGGCFRLGSSPSGQITCDVINPVDVSASSLTPASSNGYEVHALMARLLYLAKGGTVTILASALADVPDCGIYIDTETTYLDALNRLAQSAGIAWYFSSGSATDIYLLQMKDPAAQSVLLDLDAGNILREGDGPTAASTLRRITSADDDRGIPAWRVNVNYAYNYTVMSAAELAGAPAAQISFAGQQYRTASSSDSNVRTQWTRSPEITVNTLLTEEADAIAEAARLLTLYKTLRSFYTVEIAEDELGLVRLGTFVRITYARFGMGAGKKFQVLGIAPDFEKSTVTLTLWG